MVEIPSNRSAVNPLCFGGPPVLLLFLPPCDCSLQGCFPPLLLKASCSDLIGASLWGMRCVLERLRFLAESFGAVLINVRKLPGSAASRPARRHARLAPRGIPPVSSSRVCSEQKFDELVRRWKGSHRQPVINQILSWPTERPGPASSEESVLWCCSDITGLLLLMMLKFFHNCQTCSLAKSSCFVIAGSGAWSSGELDQSITAISRAESEPSLCINSCWFWACFSCCTTLIHSDVLFVSHYFSFHFPPVFHSGVYRQAWPKVLPLTCFVF